MKNALKICAIGAIGYLTLMYGVTVGYTDAWNELWNKKFYDASDELANVAKNTFKRFPKWYFETYARTCQDEKGKD